MSGVRNRPELWWSPLLGVVMRRSLDGSLWSLTLQGAEQVTKLPANAVSLVAAPVRAVSDEEHAAACANCGLPLGPPEAWDLAEVGPVHLGCPDEPSECGGCQSPLCPTHGRLR